jgi:hypothetical protein
VESLGPTSLSEIPGRNLLAPFLSKLVGMLPLVTKLVILTSLLFIREHLISLIYLLEPALR